jgi:hypothetical protein
MNMTSPANVSNCSWHHLHRLRHSDFVRLHLAGVRCIVLRFVLIFVFSEPENEMANVVVSCGSCSHWSVDHRIMYMYAEPVATDLLVLLLTRYSDAGNFSAYLH